MCDENLLAGMKMFREMLTFCERAPCYHTHHCAMQNTLHNISHNFPNSMPKTDQKAGSWTFVHESELQKLLSNNTIDYRNRAPDYLYEVTREHFPDFISEGLKGRNSAITRMQGKFLKYEEEMQLRGAQGK
jgi:hypothetical protein